MPALQSWDMTKNGEFSAVGLFSWGDRSSDTVEVMYEADEPTEARIRAAFPHQGNPMANLALEEWLAVVNMLAGSK